MIKFRSYTIRKMKKIAQTILFFLLVSPLIILAQQTTPKTTPPMQIKTASSTILLSVYGEGIVRTQVFVGDATENRWEPAIVALPESTGFTFKDGKDEAVLVTPKMKVVVNKKTSQIHYFNAKGKLLTKTSDNGGSKFMNAEKGGVSQQFLLSKDEHIYGIGQYVNGLPYVNGTACTLNQTNMEDAGHVLVSDRGYGMFWNNPSEGEFESFGDQELLSDKNVKTEDGRPGFTPQVSARDSKTKQEIIGKSTEGKITKTINIMGDNSKVDIMQSDFDKIALAQKKVTQKGITLLYNGTIHTPNRTGWYYFNVGNAGRVRFVLDNEITFENRIPHGFVWNGCRKWLEANKDYPYELFYSNNTSNVALNLFWNPTADIYKQYTWKSKCWKTIDYFVFAGTNSDEVMKGFYTVTGKASILPKWSLGYIHCQAVPLGEKKVGGFPQNDLLTLVTDYRKKQIPCDMLVQDYQWWTVMGSHIFRPDCYTDPKAWLKTIHDANFKLMISVWPNFEKTAAARYTREITAADLANRNELESKGLLVGDWANYVKPEARNVYWKQVSKSLYNDSLSVDAFWLDADEGGNKDERYGDAYPLLNKMTFAEGARSAFSNRRTFLLGRSMYPGSQRYDVAMWSGDIANDYWTLKTQVSAGLAVSACGMPYWTTDIGGFGGGGDVRDTDYSNGKDPDSETYREVVTRWFQYGMFCPIFRVHRADNNSAPWFYGEKAEKNITDAIKFRYRLMPYIYSLTKQTRENGRNPMRPLFMDFASDKNTVDITQQFMYGPAFLVCPVTKGLYSPYKGTSIETSNIQNWNVYLPKGNDWFDFNTGEKLKGGQNIQTPAPIERMPLFVRAGSIVPMGKVIQSTQIEKQTELELRIYPGADADFTLYDDDGETYDYEKSGFSEIALHWDDKAQKLTIGDRKGQFKSMPKELIFKPIIVEKGKGIGSLIEYAGDVKLNYSGAQIAWVKK